MIKFWKTTGRYGCFSNFSKHSVLIGEIRYKTVEHFYQSQKFLEPASQALVSLADTPKRAKELAGGKSEIPMPNIREDWEDVKRGIMKTALLEKARQHPSVFNSLMSTGSEPIGENSPYDYVWGLGEDGTGQNILGVLWMEVRDELRKEVNVPKVF